MDRMVDDMMLFARDNHDFHYYNYQPSKAAAYIFIVLFAFNTLVHIFRMFSGRVWFMIPFVIGCTFETLGYIGRALSAKQNPGPYTLGPYIIQSLFLLVAPALFAASTYMSLGRIVKMVDGDDALSLKRTRMTAIFVSGDIASFLLQSAGAGILAEGTTSSLSTGKWVVVGGLLIQLVFFTGFTITAVRFQTALNAHPTVAAGQTPWRKHMIVIYVVSALIFVRSIVRVVEFAQGYNGYIISHEAFLYVFDAVPMFAAVTLVAFLHPSEVARFLRKASGNVDLERMTQRSGRYVGEM